MDGVRPPSGINGQIFTLRVGDMSDLEELKVRLSKMGYDREIQIEGPGQFAVRGGILDVYPLTEEMPVRIELWGDEIDSIRMFDAKSQRSIENISEITIYPASENCFGNNGLVSFLKYFGK